MPCSSGYFRHWFTVYGHPGLRSPHCIRCGADSPRRLTEDELREFEAWERES